MVLLLPPLEQPVERRVLVQPDIQNPDPAIYQLRSPKSNDPPICLFTDFDSTINVSSITNSTEFSSKNTVLDMRYTGSKSYGALFRNNDADSECEVASDQVVYYPNLGIPCDAKLVEKSFETDMNLNLKNVLVIVFRILLLKMAGFNLLMTLRLWSS